MSSMAGEKLGGLEVRAGGWPCSQLAEPCCSLTLGTGLAVNEGPAATSATCDMTFTSLCPQPEQRSRHQCPAERH